MIKKSKKIIASLLMTLSLVSIFPITNAFAASQAEKDFLESCTKVKDDKGILYEKDGKYYDLTGGYSTAAVIAKSMFVGDHYAQEDGTLVSNKWIYANDKLDGSVWRYFGSDYKCLKGFQTLNGVRYYFSEFNGNLKIGWFVAKPGEWHYSYSDGSLKETAGWLNSNGNWYYINSYGIMAKDTTTPDGYRVNNKGVCVR